MPKRARLRLKTDEDENDEEGGEGADGANSVLRSRFGPRVEDRLSFFAYMTPGPESSTHPRRRRPQVQNRPLRLEEIRAKQQQWVNMITGESYWVTPDPMAEVEVLRLAKLLCIPQRAMVFEKDQPSDGAPRFFCLSYPPQMPYIGTVNEGGMLMECFCAICDDICLPRRTHNNGPLRECPQCGLDNVCSACLVGAPLDDKCILCLSEIFDPLYLPGMYVGAVTRLRHVRAMDHHLSQIHPESEQAHRMINGKIHYGDFSWNNVANLSSLFPFRLAFNQSFFWRSPTQ